MNIDGDSKTNLMTVILYVLSMKKFKYMHKLSGIYSLNMILDDKYYHINGRGSQLQLSGRFDIYTKRDDAMKNNVSHGQSTHTLAFRTKLPTLDSQREAHFNQFWPTKQKVRSK